MEQIGTYLLRLTAAAMVCGILTAFFGKKGAVGGTIQLLTGIYLTLNLLSPWVQLRVDAFTDLTFSISASAQEIKTSGENAARQALAERITQRTGAYILDKAQALEAELTVEVELTDETVPTPCRVYLWGDISPYAKKSLSTVLETELGIPPEEQIWNGCK